MITVFHLVYGMSKWYTLEGYKDSDAESAIRRARNYALDHGGYVCVKDAAGTVLYGTDPDELARTVRNSSDSSPLKGLPE